MVIGLSSDRTYVRTPDPSWVRTLALMTPPSERLSSLVIRWHAGSLRRASPFRKAQWIPVERWVIYQRVPMVATPPMLYAPIAYGRSTRTHPRHPNLVRGLLDRVQWELYRETGAYHQPYWIVQGDAGGHRRNYDRTEEQLAQLTKRPTEPPALGALPFAEPDSRTWAKLYQLDMLRCYKKMLAFDKRSADALDEDERDARVDMRLKILRNMDEQAYESVSGNLDAWRLALQMSGAELDRRLADNSAEIEAAERDFVLGS